MLKYLEIVVFEKFVYFAISLKVTVFFSLMVVLPFRTKDPAECACMRQYVHYYVQV